MSVRNRNIRSFVSGFFRYHQDRLSGKERNSFERELQKDPFAEEAAEGFSLISEKDAENDISDLQYLLKKRTSGKRRLIFLRIAASIAVLTLISTVYIFLEKNKTTEKLADNSVPPPELKIIMGEPLTEQVSRDVTEKYKEATQDKKTEKSAGKITEPEAVVSSAPPGKEFAGINRKDDSIKTLKVEYARALIAAEKRPAPASAMAQDRSVSSHSIRGKILSSEDNLPLPGVSVVIKGTNTGAITDLAGNFSIKTPDTSRVTLVADYIGMERKEFIANTNKPADIKLDPSLASLSEVVVTGYGIKRDDTDNEEVSPEHSPPQPSVGKSKFNKYVQENLHRPDTLTKGQRVVVILGFLVRSDGSLDSIRIVRSPGRLFSDEAIRVLKSGPAWSPAKDKGNAVEEYVRLRLVFK
jgi:hypothetical protein